MNILNVDGEQHYERLQVNHFFSKLNDVAMHLYNLTNNNLGYL